MRNILCNYPWKREIESVIYSQYDVTEINVKEKSQEISQDLFDIIMKDDFFNGDCAQILSKKVKPKKSPSPKKKSVIKQKSLADVIESQYLSHIFKPGIQNKTKASHVFNKLCTENFLNVFF